MYNGYLRFAGVELANAARTAAYAHNIAPGLGFTERWGSEGLAGVLGDGTYRTPILDPAPWFSEHRPASGKFLGFYPLSITGVEDSSREINVTELATDGAVFSLPRRASKEFRVTGLLLGEDQQGIDEGMRWLRGALEGSECTDGACTGDSFCYLAYLPAYCNFADEERFPLEPVNWTAVAGSAEPWTLYKGATFSTLTPVPTVNMPCGEDGVQYFAEGLIPGQPYRLTLEISSSSLLTVSITGRELDTTRRAAGHLDRGRTPWVYDFVAQNEVEAIRISNGNPDCTAAQVKLYGAFVERTPVLTAKFLPRFTSADYTEPPSWSPSSVPTDIAYSANVASSMSAESLRFRWYNTSGSTVNLPEGTYVRRLVRGMDIGRTYNAYLYLTAEGGVTPEFTIEGSTATTEPLGSDWYRVTWVATAPQQFLRISTAADQPLTTLTWAAFNLNYLRVDIDTSRMAMNEVDQTQQAMRSMHGVSLLDGPNVIETFPQRAGVIEMVEFTMTVARPFIYSEMFEVPLSPSATTTLVPTGSCKNGQPVRTNMFTNPFMVSAASGGVKTYAALSATGGSLSLVTDSVRFTASSNASFITIPVNTGAFLPGHTYTISATFAQSEVQDMAGNARIIRVVTGGSTITSEQAIDAAGSQRLAVTFTHIGPDQPVIQLWNGKDGHVVDWGSFLVEEGGIAGSVFSGASPNATWSGTANQSTSTWMQPNPALITDPDCPPIPNAPQPPSIGPACPRVVDEWRRYWIEVPANLSGGWTQAIPTVILTTRNNVVRDVRVRMYPNPNSLGVEDVEPCSYCGEFYVSYIPSDTVLTVDGIYESAVMDVRGTGRQTVMNLVSDADYGPIRWPSMTCDMSYYVTVDIAPDEVLDVDIRLAVSMAE